MAQRKELIEKLKSQKITFYRQVSEGQKLFGSVTALDLSSKLEKLGFMVDKKDIHLKPIKSVGEYKAHINLGQDLEADISILIKKQETLKKE